MVGMPGSGKSTFADHSGLAIVRPDDIRELLTGDMSDQSQNTKVFQMAHERTRALLTAGYDVVFDATNVTKRARSELMTIAKECDAQPWAIYMGTPYVTCCDRNQNRNRRVPGNTMVRMLKNMLKSTPEDLQSEGWFVVIHSGMPGEDA